MKKLIILFLILFGFNQGKAQIDLFNSGASLNGDNILTGINTFTDSTTFLDAITITSPLTALDSAIYLKNFPALFYNNILAVNKNTGNTLFLLQSLGNSDGNTTAIAFKNKETGFAHILENSFIAQSGADFFIANSAPGAMVIRVGGAEKDVWFFDTSGVVAMAIRNKGNDGQSMAKWRTPLPSNADFKFLRYYVDSTGNYPLSHNIENPFSNGAALKLIGNNGLIASIYTSGSDSSINFSGTLTNAINFTRDGATLFQVDNDTNQIKLYDHTSLNPVTYLAIAVDSMNSTDVAAYLRSRTTNVLWQLQNETTGFGANDGGYMRMNGVNKLDVNRENGLSQFGTNGSTSQMVLHPDGTITVGTGTDQTSLFHVEGTANITGAISIGNTINSVSPTSPNRTITMVIGGTTYYIHAKTTND